MTLYLFRSRSTLGVYRPHKTAFNNSEPIAMKFDTEIVCTQEIIMGYINLELFSKKWVLGGTPPPPNLFFLKIV